MDAGSLSLYLASLAVSKPGRWHDAQLPDRLAIHWRYTAGTYQLIISRRGAKIPMATVHRIRQASHVPPGALTHPARLQEQSQKQTDSGRVWFVLFYWLIDNPGGSHE